MSRTYNFPVFATQGGGLVREANGTWIFVEAPLYYPHLKVGDTMPVGWSIAPANDLARQEILDEFEDDDPFADHDYLYSPDDLNDELAEQVDPIEDE